MHQTAHLCQHHKSQFRLQSSRRLRQKWARRIRRRIRRKTKKGRKKVSLKQISQDPPTSSISLISDGIKIKTSLTYVCLSVYFVCVLVSVHIFVCVWSAYMFVCTILITLIIYPSSQPF